MHRQLNLQVIGCKRSLYHVLPLSYSSTLLIKYHIALDMVQGVRNDSSESDSFEVINTNGTVPTSLILLYLYSI